MLTYLPSLRRIHSGVVRVFKSQTRSHLTSLTIHFCFKFLYYHSFITKRNDVPKTSEHVLVHSHCDILAADSASSALTPHTSPHSCFITTKINSIIYHYTIDFWQIAARQKDVQQGNHMEYGLWFCWGMEP